MKIITNGQGILFIGSIGDLKKLFQDYPPETTLKDYIKSRLH